MIGYPGPPSRSSTSRISGIEGGWYRLRLCRPDPDSVSALGAECVERGVYEAWAIAAEVVDPHDRDTHYVL